MHFRKHIKLSCAHYLTANHWACGSCIDLTSAFVHFSPGIAGRTSSERWRASGKVMAMTRLLNSGRTGTTRTKICEQLPCQGNRRGDSLFSSGKLAWSRPSSAGRIPQPGEPSTAQRVDTAAGVHLDKPDLELSPARFAVAGFFSEIGVLFGNRPTPIRVEGRRIPGECPARSVLASRRLTNPLHGQREE
jgi:hypothetical protein